VARTELVDELAAAISAPAGWQAADGNLNLISAGPRRVGVGDVCGPTVWCPASHCPGPK
jgi:hypothetical protein